MAKRTKAQLKAKVDSFIKKNGNREITPEKHNSIETDEIDSFVSAADGGFDIDQPLGYSTDIPITDDRQFASKKYVDDNSGGIGFDPDEDYEFTGNNAFTQPLEIAEGTEDNHAATVGQVNATNPAYPNRELEASSGTIDLDIDEDDDLQPVTQTGALTLGISAGDPRFTKTVTIYGNGVDTLSLATDITRRGDLLNNAKVNVISLFVDANGKKWAIVFTYSIDSAPPTFASKTAISDDNYTYVQTFSKAVYTNSNGTGAVTFADFIVDNFSSTGGASGVSITALATPSNGTLSGGETVVMFKLVWAGVPNGTETFEVKPASSTSVYDAAGNAMSASATSGVVEAKDSLIFLDTFTDTDGSAPSSIYYTVTNLNSSINTINIQSNKLQLASTAANSTINQDTVVSKKVVHHGAIIWDNGVNLAKGGGVCNIGFFVDANNRAVISRPSTAENGFTINIYVGGSNVYKFDTSLAFNDQKLKITIDINNDIKFWRYNGTSWDQLGTTQNYDLGFNKYLHIAKTGNSASANTWTIDNLEYRSA